MLNCSGRNGEVARPGGTSHIGVALRIYGDPTTSFKAKATEICGIDECRASGIQLQYKRIGISSVALNRTSQREISRTSATRQECVAQRVQRDSAALLSATAAQIGGIRQHWINN